MKPKSSFSPKAGAGFTLIELLVVITIMAILAGLLFPVLGAIMEHSRKVEAASDEREIIAAVNAYFSEYGKYPIDSAIYPGDTVFSAKNNTLFDVLQNMTGPAIGNPLNPRGVPYLTIPAAQDQTMPKEGLQVSTGIWYDPWGSPYNVAVDGNYDGSSMPPHRFRISTPTPGRCSLA